MSSNFFFHFTGFGNHNLKILSILTKILQVKKIKAAQNKGLYYCKDLTIKCSKNVFQETKRLMLPCYIRCSNIAF